MLYPFTFRPIFKERVWGGRELERLYHKLLPPGGPIGESWELSDRPGDVSVITNGTLAGKDLRWLMENHSADLLGEARPQGGRFPLLIKILDAQDKLSLQVHPPPAKAAELGGEPKTEMWYVTNATPSADLYVGLRRGVTRSEFERRLQAGTVADCFHRHTVQAGDAMFLPSGRVHAIGAGNVVFEIQENSDTTYRVFDWNRVGLDGQARALHVEQSLACIDFNDFEPGLVASAWQSKDGVQVKRLAEDPLFTVDLVRAPGPIPWRTSTGVATVLGVLHGALTVRGGGQQVIVEPGGFCLLPAGLNDPEVELQRDTEFLTILPG